MSYLSDTLGESYKEGMTEEEISAALETIQNKSLDHLKAQLSKANSEAADWKRQLREKQSEEERKAAEAQEQQERLLAENEELKRNAKISNLKASFSAIGASEEMTNKFVSELIDGETSNIASLVGSFLSEKKSEWEADAIRQTGRPSGGGAGTVGVDYDRLINQAQADGDIATVAYYTRLKQSLED